MRFPWPPYWLTQFVIFAASGCLAFALRFDFAIGPDLQQAMLLALAVWLAVKPCVFWFTHLNRGRWCFVSFGDVLSLTAGNLLASLLSAGILLGLATSSFPRSVVLLDFLICLHATAGVRVIARGFRDYVRHRESSGAKRIVIYGAGHAGDMLLREIRSNSRLQYHVCGFIDDDPQKHKLLIQSVRVLGSGDKLKTLKPSHSIAEVLIAIPSVDRLGMLQILQHCQDAGLHCKTIPCMADIIEGIALTPQIRAVAVEDLLGRTQVRLNDSAIRAKLQDSVVVVTGAAGSIGSEICRQVARFQPRVLIGFDAAETPLFHLDREFRNEYPNVVFHSVIGTISDVGHLDHLFRKYKPSIVYHAAAYKHVPIMEFAVNTAVENNVLGTANVAEIAQKYGVTDFVMISSDKAVRPTNVMGLTKRAAELVIGSLQNGGTKFVSVRFGNVLGSNGSVIPIFKQQIAMRRPVTVTHPDMTRFFMTIPEAAQLVLQASTMSKGGEIFVLDMGPPVKIVDLARNLILLSGLRPDQDIPIEFTGLRPGEKLFEELHLLHENILPTYHDKIKIFSGPIVSFGAMARSLAKLRHCCSLRDERGLILELNKLVPEYTPSHHVLQQVPAVMSADLAALHEAVGFSNGAPAIAPEHAIST